MKTMATKKAAAKTKKTVAKRAAGKVSKKTKGIKKGDKYACSVCGMVVSVDKVCGCVDVCDLICCGKQMKSKK